MRVSSLDYCVIATYFAGVIAVGFWLRTRTRSSSEFFLSSRSLPAWVTGFAFMSANLGSLEVMGHAANGAKYGMMAASVFYWLGAIPAMVFLGIFMMPFYYNNRVRSSPEYLKLRFDERSHAFNAIGFAVLTILMSGINMYALALVFKVFLNWPIGVSTLVSALGVMIYIVLGGLRAAIYNEVIQFFLVFIGLLPLTFFGLREVGGWHGLTQRLPFDYVHAYAILGNSHDNPMGLPWYAVVVAFTMFAGTSYWCTDFLIVQRALAARDLLAARQTPLIAAFFKMLSPAMIVVPGLIALVVIPDQIHGNYNLAIPLLLERYYPPGLLGIGLTALIASFMSGMAGNVTAFNTVWTYDIYQAYIRPDRSEQHYVRMGRAATVVGTLLSVGTSYIATRFANMGDYLVLVFSLFIFPMSAAFLLGMFWKRASSDGAFYGMIVGVASTLTHYGFYYFGIVRYRTDMAANAYIIVVGWLMSFLVIVGVSLVGEPRPEQEIEGLVYSRSSFPWHSGSWHQEPAVWGIGLLGLMGILAAVFW
jgi:solute:Na+ symporter, SSS family